MSLKLSVIVFCFSCLTGRAQLHRFYYPQKSKFTSSKPLEILKTGDEYLFKSPRDTIITISGKISDTVFSGLTFGPYQFKQVEDRIKFKNSSDSSFSDLYLLKKDTAFLIPELWNGLTDSRPYICRYVGDSLIFIEGHSYNCFIFFVDSNEDDSKYLVYKKIYLSKEFLIPIKIERYADPLLTKLMNVTEALVY